MYLRLGFPSESISSELNNLLKHISRYAGDSTFINNEAFEELKAYAINSTSFEKNRDGVLASVESLIEVNDF